MELLPWSTPLNAVPTRFMEQIVNSLQEEAGQKLSFPMYGTKRHTLRRAKQKPRFREGMLLQFCTGPRYQQEVFADGYCTGVQLVHLNALHREFMAIDGPPCYSWQLVAQMGGRLLPLKELAANDGLALHDFTRWFLLDVLQNGPGMYELVHWTNTRY